MPRFPNLGSSRGVPSNDSPSSPGQTVPTDQGEGLMDVVRLCASKGPRLTTNIRVGAIGAAVAMIFMSGCGSATSPVQAGATWSTPVRVEPNGLSSSSPSVYSVSCPSSTLCVAVDENGSALMWHGGKWSAPQPVGAGGTLTSVSCPSTTYCVAVTAGGRAVTYDGQSWSMPVSIGPSATYEVSCPTVTFCATVGASGTAGAASTFGTFDGHSWSTQQTSSTGAVDDRLMDVSCATQSFCVAVNLDGHTLNFDGTKWLPGQSTGPQGLMSVSCPSTTFCMAVVTSGASTTFQGKSWSTQLAIPGFGAAFARSVSCGSTTRCTAMGLSGQSARWQDGRWSQPVLVFPGGFLATEAVSCLPSNTCVAVNSKGDAATSKQTA